MINISDLPSRGKLRQLAQDGCLTLVNLSGSSLKEMYGEKVVSAFTLSEYSFSDFFSQREIFGGVEIDDPSLFINTFTPEQQENFLMGVQAAVACVRKFNSVSLFCHHGVGRSPAVALSLMLCAWNWSITDAVDAIRQIRPQAHISDLSVSASSWAKNRLR